MLLLCCLAFGLKNLKYEDTSNNAIVDNHYAVTSSTYTDTGTNVFIDADSGFMTAQSFILCRLNRAEAVGILYRDTGD